MKLYVKYFLFVYILAISSFEFFFRVHLVATYLLLPLVLLLFNIYNFKFESKVIRILIPFFLAYILQSLLFNSPIHYAFTLSIRLFVFYLTIKIIGIDFINIFIKVIKIISLVSIIFYSLEHITGIQNIMLNFCQHFTNLGTEQRTVPVTEMYKPNFIIYALQTDYEFSYIRNAGPFWEPGIFVIFLNIALFLNLFLKKKFIERANIIFVTCIITTFSTTGYIVLLLNLAFFAFAGKKISINNRIFIILLLLIMIPFISSLSFMKGKIDNQIEQSDVSYSRFGAAIVHWKIIQDYPLTGLPYDETTYSEYADNISPNGITEIFLRYGVIVGFLYYLFLYNSSVFLMRLIGYKKKGYMFFIILILLIFGENMGNKPIYLILLFLPLIDYHKTNNSVKIPINISLKNYIKPL